MAKGMQGPSFNQIMMLGGLGVAAIAAYEVYVNLPSIQAAIQSALNPINMYQQQGYYCPSGGVPSPQGLCPNGQPAINQSQFNQLASMTGGCSDGSIVNPSTGRCANGTLPMSSPYGGYGTSPYGSMGYPQTSVCNDGSQPNMVNGLCANGSIPTSVGTGVDNAMVSPYGAPQYVNPTITGGVGVPGGTTFTDPTTGQMYDPSTGMLLTPGGSYNTPSLASPYSSIFPTLSPLAGNGIFCGDGSNPSATGACANGQQAIGWPQSSPPTPAPTTTPVATTITTANPSGTMSCADGSTASSTTGLCANGQAPSTALPAGTTTSTTGAVPVTATPTGTGTTTVTPTTPAPAPTPAPTPVTTTQPVTQTSPAPVTTTTPQTSTQSMSSNPMITTITAGGGGSQGGGFNRFGGQQQGSMSQNRWGGRFGYVGYQSEGAMIAAQAFGSTPRDRTRASVTSYSSVRPKVGNSPITTEVFGRRYFPQQPIYVSNSR